MLAYSLLGLVVKGRRDQEILVEDGVSEFHLYDLVVVDECSMIGADIFDFIADASHAHPDTKIIFVGDPAQLPPVGEDDSPTFKIRQRAILTNIVRQAEGNPIIGLAAAIRNAQNNGERVNVREHVGHSDEHGLFLMPGEHFERWMPQAFKSEAYQNNPDRVRIISWRNSQVIRFNRKVREILHGGRTDAPFIPGERAITAGAVHRLSEGKKQSAKLALHSAVEGQVLECARTIHPWFDDDRFNVWEVLFQPDDRDEVTLYLPDVSEKERIKSRLQELANQAINDDDVSWGPFWKLKRSMEDLRPCHAITTHRSQGSTYRNVFVDAADIMRNPNRAEALRSLYTGITRASDRVILNLATI